MGKGEKPKKTNTGKLRTRSLGAPGGIGAFISGIFKAIKDLLNSLLGTKQFSSLTLPGTSL